MASPRTIGLLLALITLVVYLPAAHHDFIVFDDPDYVTENRIVQSGITAPGIVWAFTSFHASNWHPVTWLSHMLDCAMFGLNPGAQHILSALLHSANAVLVFMLLLQWTRKLWPAAVVAALFAWHPLRVESVAWISERKDVLSLFFGLLCLLTYAKHTQEFSKGNRTSRFYWLALSLFALGLMAKPMLVTLPFVMLLLDWWPLGRCNNFNWRAAGQSLVLEKVPFFLLVVVSSALTVLAQRTEAVVALEHVPFELRLKNAVVACGGYLLDTLWPKDLALLYPLPKEVAFGKVVAAAAVLIGITLAAWHWRREKPHFIVGWFWFLGTLVPVIGIVQVGGQAMADRYTYLPHIGLFMAIVFEIASLTGKSATISKVAMAAAVVLSLAGLAATTRQLSYWKDSETIFNRTIAVTGDNPVAHINLGVALEQQGRLAEARAQYEIAARLDPNRVQAQVNLANVWDALGDSEKALEHYRLALQLNRNSPLVHINYGSALVKLGRFEEAKLQFDEARRLAPDDPRPAHLQGKSLLRQGRSQEAVAEFKEALRSDPDHLQTLVWFARVRANDFDGQARHAVEAVALAKRAVELTGGNDPFVLETLAAAYAEAGRFVEAVRTMDQTLHLLSQSGDTNTAALVARQKLYQAKQPYREAFTNAPATSPMQR